MAVAGLAAWQVYINLNEIIDRWVIVIGFSAGVFIIVTLALYMPLLRHIADIIQDRMSAFYQRIKARRTGLGLDEIPSTSFYHPNSNRFKTRTDKATCSICGGPGGPVCEACRKKMSTK
jgi:hypothetical protein